MREPWRTGSEGYVKPTWNADALPQTANWFALCCTMPRPLTAALSLLKLWLPTHRNWTGLLMHCYACMWVLDQLEHVFIMRMRMPKSVE